MKKNTANYIMELKKHICTSNSVQSMIVYFFSHQCWLHIIRNRWYRIANLKTMTSEGTTVHLKLFYICSFFLLFTFYKFNIYTPVITLHITSLWQ